MSTILFMLFAVAIYFIGGSIWGYLKNSNLVNRQPLDVPDQCPKCNKRHWDTVLYWYDEKEHVMCLYCDYKTIAKRKDGGSGGKPIFKDLWSGPMTMGP